MVPSMGGGGRVGGLGGMCPWQVMGGLPQGPPLKVWSGLRRESFRRESELVTCLWRREHQCWTSADRVGRMCWKAVITPSCALFLLAK